MGSEAIKSSSDVISEFLSSLQGEAAIDADTLAAVHDLFAAGKLNRTRLLTALETLRAGNTASAKKVTSDAHGSDQ